MAGMIPTALFGLHVPCGTEPIPAIPELGPIFRITMAALDPTIPPNSEDPDAAPRATLRIIKEHIDFDDDEDDEDDDDEDDSIDAIERRLAAALSDDEDEEESGDDGKNGGPSDPAKSKKAKKEALLKALKEGFADEDEDDDETPNGVNGVKKNKGKGKGKIATELEDVSISDVSMSDIEDSEDLEFEEFVVCTLDTDKHYQQPLDITVGDDERVYFQVIGTHDIYLTGNYVIPPQDHEDDEDEDDYDEDEYDLPPYEDEELSEDELDGLPDPRVEELDSEEEAPKLIKAAKALSKSKASKKRAAEDEDDEDAETLDNLISKTLKAEPATNGDQKLSKKQLKKLKNNQGQAVPAASTDSKPATASSTKEKEAKESKETPTANGNAKKVQFAKNLEQGPTPSPANKGESKKTGLGVKVIKGVTVDDKKLGSGRAAKTGDKVGMRYIGKLATDGKVFDANKKGAPFRFTLGKGEVIKGWDIGVEGITVGGERRITIPANLAYGSKAIPKIPANSTLVFDIKCLSIN